MGSSYLLHWMRKCKDIYGYFKSMFTMNINNKTECWIIFSVIAENTGEENTNIYILHNNW